MYLAKNLLFTMVVTIIDVYDIRQVLNQSVPQNANFPISSPHKNTHQIARASPLNLSCTLNHGLLPNLDTFKFVSVHISAIN